MTDRQRIHTALKTLREKGFFIRMNWRKAINPAMDEVLSHRDAAVYFSNGARFSSNGQLTNLFLVWRGDIAAVIGCLRDAGFGVIWQPGGNNAPLEVIRRDVRNSEGVSYEEGGFDKMTDIRLLALELRDKIGHDLAELAKTSSVEHGAAAGAFTAALSYHYHTLFHILLHEFVPHAIEGMSWLDEGKQAAEFDCGCSGEKPFNQDREVA